MLHSYPKILPLVGKYAGLVIGRPVEVTEKVDGSMFAFGRDPEGQLWMRSKGQMLDPVSPVDLFRPAVEHVLSIQDRIPNDTAFYGETLKSPRHNTLVYDRVPAGHIALFGAFDFARTKGASYPALAAWATEFECDVVPALAQSHVYSSVDEFLALLDRKSFLGGQSNIEGIVIKDYSMPCEFNGMVYPLTVLKLVSEGFKEQHANNPDWVGSRSKEETLYEQYRTEARWMKAIQHLAEKGQLVYEPKDIGALMKELNQDTEEECKQDFMEKLYAIHRKGWLARITNGFPEFYKRWLLTHHVDNQV